MQECRMIYRCDDNFVGNVHEVANHLGISVANVYRAVYHDKTINDQYIKKIQDNRLKFMVINEGGRAGAMSNVSKQIVDNAKLELEATRLVLDYSRSPQDVKLPTMIDYAENKNNH